MTVLATLLGFFLSFTPLQEKKLPAPDPPAQAAARKLIHELFRDDFAGKGDQARVALRAKLLSQARQTVDDPAGRFVLYLEVRDLEAEARNIPGISAMVDELAVLYAVDAAQLKAEGVAAMIGKLKTDVETLDAARQLLVFAGEALESEEVNAAQKALDQASGLAKKVKNLPLLAKAEAKGKEIAEHRQRLEAAVRARETLQKSPSDPASNLAVGRFECLGRGDWAAGLPFLQKGSDPALRTLAEKDLSAPSSTDAQAALGNGWWDLGEGEKDPLVKRRLRARAAYWYEKAEGQANGLQKTVIANRLSDFRIDRIGGAWTDYTDPKLFLLSGKPGEAITPALGDQPGRLVTLEKWPSGDYDGVSVRVRRGAPKTAAAAMLLFDPEYCIMVEPEAGVVAVQRMDREKVEWNREHVEKVDTKDVYELMAVLSGGEWLAYVDGKLIFRVATRKTQLSDVGLQIQLAIFSFEQLRLRKKN